MKKVLCPLSFVLCLLLQTACRPQQPIVIFYENDVHCAIDGYARLAALRNAERDTMPYVVTVSAGDFVQGNTTGSLSRGEYIVDIMNTVGYDVVTIGNHEFDYSVPQMKHLMQSLHSDVVCCNLTGKAEGDLFAPYVIKRYGRTRVAFVGVATPTTFNTSTPTYFRDSVGNIVYDFHREDCYERVQHAADDARKRGADYVILLSHLGDDTDGWNSIECIHATRGIDIVLDGHSHNVLLQREANLDGDSIWLSSTGTAFRNIGRLTITPNGGVQPELLPIAQCEGADSTVAAAVAHSQELLAEMVNQPVSYTPFLLADCDAAGERIVRHAETNLGDLLTDAMRLEMHTDIAMANGGGIRTRIPAGSITMGSLYAIWPFNNSIRVIRGTGQQILDALEAGAKLVPADDGDFFHVSGLRYTIDTSVRQSVVYDENGLFDHVGATRRVVAAEVLDENGMYHPIDPERLYTVAAQSYIAVSGGAGGALLPLQEVTVSENPGDIELLVRYFRHLGDTVPTTYRTADSRILIK